MKRHLLLSAGAIIILFSLLVFAQKGRIKDSKIPTVSSVDNADPGMKDYDFDKNSGVLERVEKGQTGKGRAGLMYMYAIS